MELHQVIRVVRCDAGMIALDVHYSPRPDYARMPADLEPDGLVVVWEGPGERLTLDTSMPLRTLDSGAEGALTLRAGEETVFVLTYQGEDGPESPDDLAPEHRVERTIQFWKSKAAELEYRGPWRDEEEGAV